MEISANKYREYLQTYEDLKNLSLKIENELQRRLGVDDALRIKIEEPISGEVGWENGDEYIQITAKIYKDNRLFDEVWIILKNEDWDKLEFNEFIGCFEQRIIDQCSLVRKTSRVNIAKERLKDLENRIKKIKVVLKENK